MSLGQTVKHIRKTKNIKLKHICGNTIDMGNYWRFEEGRISVSAETFYQIVNNLNVAFDEFAFYHNNNKPDKLEEWGHRMIEAFQSKDIEELKLITKKTKAEFKGTQQIKYQHLYYLAKIYLELINKSKIDPTWITELKQYLTECEEWGYYEVTLFNNILFYFSDLDTILVLYKRMNQSHLRSKRLHRIPNEEIIVAINIICLCIIDKAYSSAKEINQYIQAKVVGERSMFARTLLLWCDGLVSKIILNKDDGFKKIESSLEIMKTLNMHSSFNMFERWTNQLLYNQSLKKSELLF